MTRNTFFVLLALAALPLLLNIKGGDSSTTRYRLARIAQPYLIAGAAWVPQNLAAKLQKEPGEISTPENVFVYLDLVERYQQRCPNGWQSLSTTGDEGCQILRADLDSRSPMVERLVQQQISDSLGTLGLKLNQGPLDTVFPPVMFIFRAPPKLLVASPRHRIELAGSVLLQPDLPLEEAARLETLVSSSGLSGMVTRIGGLGIYPSILPENRDLLWVLQTVAHEWCHQFLAFKPLGWKYAFGIEADRRIVAINETTAEVIGREVGNQVFKQSYGGPPEERPGDTASVLRFREQMRELRAQVDLLLDEGQIEEAEALMERRRLQLNAQGYNIRVLNQAYFAFHGSYADDPYLSGRMGEEVSQRIRRLREKSASLGAFLGVIATVESYEDFLRITNE